MTAMQTASDNARAMLKRLNLSFTTGPARRPSPGITEVVGGGPGGPVTWPTERGYRTTNTTKGVLTIMSEKQGTIVQVMGPVVDVLFERTASRT